MTNRYNCGSEEMLQSPVNIMVAHALEAKPLISLLDLDRLAAETEFTAYGNQSGLRLIVSGIGKEAMRSAVVFLAGEQKNDENMLRAWLNIGICGHRNANIASAFLANKITDQDSARSAYPPQLLQGHNSSAVVTVSEPEREYPQLACYEMEALAFYEEASKHATAELVQVFKIVSDNLDNPIDSIDLKSVPVWIAQHKEQILILVTQLSRLATAYNASQRLPSAFRAIRAKMHFTVSQETQLKRLCQRFAALGREDELDTLTQMKYGTAKQILQVLSTNIDNSTGV